MISELCISQADLAELRERLLGDDVEGCAVLFVSTCRRSDGQVRLLTREVTFPSGMQYQSRTTVYAQLSPAFVAEISKKAKRAGLGLVFVHSHPKADCAEFSLVDDEGEEILARFLHVRGVEGPHGSLLLAAKVLRARELAKNNELRVVSIGDRRILEFNPMVPGDSRPQEIFDRQVRAFGAAGQAQIESLRVAVVGLGGTGSIAAQQLAHLGVRRFVLIDPDEVETTNLNRVVGSSPSSIGMAKVDVAANCLAAIREDIEARTVEDDVVHSRVARELIDADLIMCCTDSHGSRSVVQQIAYQYMIPCVDMGSTITQRDGKITGIFGRIQLLAPGMPCLWCSHLLDPTQVRRDMANEAEQRLDPYIVGGAEPAPSVISLNGTVVSLAVSMVLALVAGVPIPARHVIYNAMNSTLRSVRGKSASNCFICSRNGALAWGDRRRLFARED
jgi:molybdopterin/thiamine biosynthesis adenylyltransferase